MEPIPWRGFRAIDTLFALALAGLATAALILPFLDHVLLRRLARLPGTQAAVVWLVNDGGAWIVGGALLFTLIVFLVWKRQRIVSDKRLWTSTGCPNCQERELVRVSRHFSDRFYGLVAIPAYRYACRNCTWRGLRVARREHSRELDAELEAALLRFDPESPLPGPDAAGRPRRGSTVFRDAGDVTALAATPVSSMTNVTHEGNGDETPVTSANHEAETEDVSDEAEWIWRQPDDGA